MRSGVAGLIAAGWLLSLAAPAHATYCRSKACDDKLAFDDVWQTEPDPPCDRDVYGCLLEGKPLFWPRTCMSFSVQKDGSLSDGIDYETATAVIGGAFQTWMDAECPGGGTPSFAIVDYGPVDCTQVGYRHTWPNSNTFVFRDDDWPYPDGRSSLALTTVSYDRETGEIYDADVEINSFLANITVGDESVEYDFASVMTHEIGHFLGLSHNDNELTTMWWRYDSGTTNQRYLHEEDIAGICEIYPPDRSVDTSNCTPNHGFTTQCQPQDKVRRTSGCALSAAETRPQPGLLGLAVALVAAFVARRRRRRNEA